MCGETPNMSSNGEVPVARGRSRYPYKTRGRQCCQSASCLMKVFLIPVLMVRINISARPCDVEAEVSTVLHPTPFFFMKSKREMAVKQPALSEIIAFGGRSREMISLSTNSITTSAEAFFVTAAIGHPVKCSTTITRNLLPR